MHAYMYIYIYLLVWENFIADIFIVKINLSRILWHTNSPEMYVCTMVRVYRKVRLKSTYLHMNVFHF